MTHIWMYSNIRIFIHELIHSWKNCWILGHKYAWTYFFVFLICSITQILLDKNINFYKKSAVHRIQQRIPNLVVGSSEQLRPKLLQQYFVRTQMLWPAQNIVSRIPNPRVCFEDSFWLVKKNSEFEFRDTMWCGGHQMWE
mgnify:CR=1 FL=1